MSAYGIDEIHQCRWLVEEYRRVAEAVDVEVLPRRWPGMTAARVVKVARPRALGRHR